MDWTLSSVATLITELGALAGILIPIIILIRKIMNGQKCQLRSDMLQIYYKYKDEKKIHQYEKENFVLLYEAYKALKGNSFIDTIYTEVMKWETIM